MTTSTKTTTTDTKRKMTTTEPTRPQRKPRRRLSAIPVFATMALLFLATFVLLTAELIGGRDPALGAKALDSVKPKRPIVVRKVIKRRVITTVVPSQPVVSYQGSTGTYPGGSSSSGSTYVAPSTTTVAPAPAPAPAPVVSSAS